jgi:hypothetical protein
LADRYCINQTSDEIKHRQIENMQKIYAGSQITLIAAAGYDPNYGLAGVSKTRQELWNLVTVGGITLIHGIHPYSDFWTYDIALSSWNHRAWTYQETLFSKRRLFCTDSTMIFAAVRLL